jgi:hypothetical protein
MDLEALIRQVKLNCSISDAKFWGYYSICGLLMRMRELYLNEHSLLPWDNVPVEEVTRWISSRETEWHDLEEAELKEIGIDGKVYGPFDIEAINPALIGSNLVYGSGYATFNKPTFFVAELIETKELMDYRVYFMGRELCRDLSAYAAMLQGRCIYIRRDVIRTIIFDKFQMLKSRRYGGVTEEMFGHFGIRKSDAFSAGLADRLGDMAIAASELFVRHEVGEAFEDEGAESWAMVLSLCNDKHSELYLRGVKDLLADTSEMGPLKYIADAQNRPLLDVYISFLDGLRREIFPEVGTAFQRFVETGEWSLIQDARAAGYEKSGRWREEVLRLWKDEGMDAVKKYLLETFSKRRPSDG